MSVLVLDTASRFCSACVYDPAADTILAAREEAIGRGHAERLMGVVADVMDEAGAAFGDLTGLTVTIGPGSFTGIRVGVAAARGIAVARSQPVTGVTTLESLAVQAVDGENPAGPFAVLIGGGRGQIFMQHFSADCDALDAARAVPEDTVSACLRPDCALLVGDAATAVGSDLPNAIDRPVGTIGAVARAGRLFAHAPSPLYLRGADAKPQTGFALPRRSDGENAA
ncbi:MAG: tRNA (adenosine(37)-N6)-threonylcarbamoyltransferase complex dimerization subunit type 1 TsaB [Roseitalea sp.]|jgi:tRNA threonylcarbamoyladenosine biosynthesis protein TsaB|nr:tRNA (adenosine(37)-N6)-threonylcarbamoyltransferase complex dimerization subunit type 1 TsaB [Roseitalea sp.]MBO6722165.1 tRNA (adenosine(37)-N6)-threonylcarbamoyltransferase complex dimerization subunit type 1 TsaB [Roseitalea sp.]MBO6744907.1 tRNA (adenosine(37)-N6)-threonylcarbamoyltransferase complex dimerization subunit type 1 TsaB [Roseitalea sp.]